MKVKLPENYKRVYSLEDLERAKKVIAAEKGDDFTPADYAEMAIRHISGRHSTLGISRIIEAKAETAINPRIWDRFDDDSGNIDISIDYIAETYMGGFMRGSAFVSDLWDITGDNDLTCHMWYRFYSADE